MFPMTPHVVFTTERSPRHQRAALQAAPPEWRMTLHSNPGTEALYAALSDADYLISERRGQVDAAMLAAAPHLKLIVRLGSLAHDIDLAAAREAGVMVSMWPVGGAIRAAEHVILQMLAISKQLRRAEEVALNPPDDPESPRRTDENTFAYNWAGLTGIDSLWGRTVGILGFGEIGAELARRLQGWGCTVRYHKRRPLPPEVERQLGAVYADRATLLRESDYFVNLLPYSAATEHLIDAAFIAQMKAGVWFVSAGSGSVIDEAALVDAVRRGHVAGAALDTFEWEPLPPENPLVAAARAGANILLTPHIAGGTTEAARRELAQLYTPILRHLAGEPVPYRLV
ncbi:MAG: 2-hydroxyacid dehydrogenase family protein [Anaerolineae bacterium]